MGLWRERGMLRRLRAADRVRIDDALDVVGMRALAGRQLASLSGGQRQRVVLAIALANDPALLVCDEPTTALDVTVQALVLDLIVSGVEARDAALLLITHDLSVVATACERVLVMYGGRIVEDHRALLVLLDLVAAERRSGRVALPVTTTRIAEQVAAYHGTQVTWTTTSPDDLTRVAREEGTIFGGDARGGFIVPEFSSVFDGSAAFVRLIGLVASEYTVGLSLVEEIRAGLAEMKPDRLATHVIGGLTVAESGLDLGKYRSRSLPAAALDDESMFVLPPLPNSLFTRDSSCWIFGGVSINPMYWPARRLEAFNVATIYRYHPMFRDAEFDYWYPRLGDDGRMQVRRLR